MKAIVPVLAAAALAAAAVAACGNIGVNDDLFSGNGGAGGNIFRTSASTGATSGVTGGNGPASSSVATGPGSTTGPSSSVASSSSSVASSTAASSTSGGPPANPVYCDTTACDAGQVCCFNPNGPGDHCGTAGMCDSGFIEISCTTPGGCPNGSCCADVNFMMNVPYTGIACQPSCNNMQIVLCSQDNPGVCPPMTLCQQSQSLGPDYFICWPM